MAGGFASLPVFAYMGLIYAAWDHSPVMCQYAVSEIDSPLIPDGVVLLHYLDDFMLVCTDAALLASATCRFTEAFSRSGFIVSPTSALSPVTRIFFLGKWLDLTAHTISSHPKAFLQMPAA